MIGCSPQFVRRLVAAGELACRKVGSSWAVDAASVASFALNRRRADG